MKSTTILFICVLAMTAAETPQTDQCDYACASFVYQPVCGSNGAEQKMFEGLCELERENCRKSGWQFVKYGKCS